MSVAFGLFICMLYYLNKGLVPLLPVKRKELFKSSAERRWWLLHLVQWNVLSRRNRRASGLHHFADTKNARNTCRRIRWQGRLWRETQGKNERLQGPRRNTGAQCERTHQSRKKDSAEFFEYEIQEEYSLKITIYFIQISYRIYLKKN